MIAEDDNENAYIGQECFCKSKHCDGQLYVHFDNLKGEKCAMITIVDTSGNDEGKMWMNRPQLETFIVELRRFINDNWGD